ncbi:hypothetical protein EK21DRAFT_52135, partial [Setomelanomma holmii]
MFFSKVVPILIALGSVAQADWDEEQVGYALTILQDLPTDLAIPFCQDYAKPNDTTTTCTVTGYPTTITTTLPPTVCSDSTIPYTPPIYSPTEPLWIRTVSSTTTLTYYTTSTIYVPATEATSYGYKARRNADGAFDRATWCSNENLPCRLVQYSQPVIADAYAKYLSSGSYGSGGYVVTATITVTPCVTETATPSCTSEYDAGYAVPTESWYAASAYE